MVYSEKEIKETEEELTRYFRRRTEISKLKNRIEFLEKRKSQIQKNIESSNIQLDVIVSGFSFDRESIQSSAPISSQQEKALESAFAKLERQVEHIDSEIMNTNMEIQDLEYLNCDMGFVLGQLDEMARSFIQLRYEKRLGYTKISLLLNSSTATVNRLRIKIVSAVREYNFCVRRK